MRGVALITGAGSGVGRAAALALLRAGFSVVLAGRRRAALDETARLAADQSSQALVVSADITQPESVGRLFAETVQRFGRLDLLFNNAGINVPATPLEELTWQQWQSVVAVNLSGLFLCTQQAFRIMKDQEPMGGRIINNGSVSSQVPRPNSAAYTATKHAVSGLTKSALLEGRKYNIGCGQIDIGNALTEMSAESRNGTLQANGSMAAEPMMDVEDVARAVVYMATLPLEANVPFMTVMATKMPLVGRG